MNLRRHKTYVPSSSAPLFLLCTLGSCEAARAEGVVVIASGTDGVVGGARVGGIGGAWLLRIRCCGTAVLEICQISISRLV